jgi:hypothetical protein
MGLRFRSVRCTHPARPGRRLVPQTAAGMIAVAVLAVLTAACGGSGGPPSAGGSSSPGSYVAYSACMREHGIPSFPDPDPQHPEAVVGKQSAAQLGVSTATYQSAHRSCVHLIPPPSGDTPEQQQELQCAQGGTCPQEVVQAWMSGLRQLAACLRTHGEPRWPDPIVSSLAGHPPAPHFPYEQAGIDHHSQKVLTEVGECTRITGFQGLPLP